ncbi:unnamed protein product [Ilex paraguariensis]|uniref:Uncharacterized protein n=1 Tax=Ilex paraguariensis TaxID=185542 RepID=A0ABC8RUV0_9AQUA
MLSVKQAREEAAARIRRRMRVMGRVAASQEPLLVKIGVRSWKARRVPVGRRLARWAVLSRARWDKEGGIGGGSGGGVSSATVGVEVVGLARKDILGFGLWRGNVGGGVTGVGGGLWIG